jgi:hypothetical protein
LLTFEPPERGKRTRWAAVGLIVVLEIGAFVYLYPSFFGAPQGPAVKFSFPTTSSTTKTSTSTKPPQNSIVITSAIISDNILRLGVKNTGTTWTKNMTVAYICTPAFLSCYSYKLISGLKLTRTFVLAPQGKYVYNITAICVVPMAHCRQFHPLANFSYYFEVSFGYANGASVTLPVTARAINTFPPSASVQGLTYNLETFPKNGTGLLTVRMLINSSLDSASFTVRMFMMAGRGKFILKHVNKIGCGGDLPVSCSSGNLTMIATLSTVATGIGTPNYPPPYVLTVQDQSVLPKTRYFVLWVATLTE